MDDFIEAQASMIGEITPPLEDMRRWVIEVGVRVNEAGYISGLRTEVDYPYVDPATGGERWGGKDTLTYFYDHDEPIRIERPEVR